MATSWARKIPPACWKLLPFRCDWVLTIDPEDASAVTQSRGVGGERELGGKIVPQGPSALLRVGTSHPALASSANQRQFRHIWRTGACERISSRRIVAVHRRELNYGERCGGRLREARRASRASHPRAFPYPSANEPKRKYRSRA